MLDLKTSFVCISISSACIPLLPSLFNVPGCCSGLLLVAVVNKLTFLSHSFWFWSLN